MWETLKARWRSYQHRREEARLLSWKSLWRPPVWSAFVPYKYLFTPHKAVQGHIAVIILPLHRYVVYRPDLTHNERRLVGAMALEALKRMHGMPEYCDKGTLKKPYVILTKDLRFPEGPEDNEHWIDWIRALEYLAPIAYVDHIVSRYPQKAELYLAQVFDLDPPVAKHRLNEHRMWKDNFEHSFHQPTPARMTE